MGHVDKAEKINGTGRDLFMQDLPNRMLMMAAAWEDLCKVGWEDSSAMESLAPIMIVVDTLKDKCAAQGLQDLSNYLGQLEMALNGITEIHGVEQEKIIKEVKNAMSYMVQVAEHLAGNNAPLLPLENVIILEQPPVQIPTPVFNSGEGDYRHVFIVSDDDEFIAECSIQMGHYGYSAHSFNSLESFDVGLSLGEPVAVIADLDLITKGMPEGQDIELEGLSKFKSTRGDVPVPMIVVATTSSFVARLQAVKAGSAAFFAKPVSVALLLDKLDAIISNAYVVEPFRILVVDDSATMSRFLSRTLTQAGMSVHVENSPDKVLASIGEFNPDLILMDMYMPFCDGQELSRIIRQYETFTSIPIVFLSSEMDIKKQLAAMQIGADDFLTKPIDPEHLVGSITTRVQRHRILSSYMVQDSLTGLLNHTKLKQRLDQTLQKAVRSKLPLSFAMIDIDHFKNVNDTYGHPTGDRVIKSLSRLLQKRLRKTDSIGRYGGEEFAIIFWDADATAASVILDSIRADFSRIEHHHEGKLFSCTFSGGISGFPDYPDAQAISSAADRALYVAKRAGRNRIIIGND